MSNQLKCRMVSHMYQATEWPDFDLEGITFSAHVPLDQADGLFVAYDPNEELMQFNGPKLWLTQEPMSHSLFHTHTIGKRLAKVLRPDEWAFFSNPLTEYRIPQITARQFTQVRSPDYQAKAVATVNDSGGRFGWLKKRYVFRNKFVTCPLVELFGNKQGWSQYSRFPFVWKKGLPSNFGGSKALGADYHDPLFLEFLSRYKVYVCLENSYEPFWFTEKFVNAARAGCIPVYHSHPTVAETFLKGARWVDPKDFSFDPRRTIKNALSQDIDGFRRANNAWLASKILLNTTQDRVMGRAFELMAHKILQAKSERAQK